MAQITFADGIGIIGAALIVGTYFLLQIGRLDSRSLPYSISNGLGASGILFSLFYDFNLSAFAIDFGAKPTMKKYTAHLWVLAGFLFMLPSILGNGRTELVPIGIVFLVVGITSRPKDSKPESTDSE